jgi:hypothetical protein
MKVIILALGIVGLVGCATGPTAWVVQSTPDGGVMGYTGATSDALPLIKPHVKATCGTRKVTVTLDQLKTRETSRTVYMPVSSTATTDGNVYSVNRYPMSYDQTTQVNSMVPVQERGLDSWREVTYECR